jgi:hypothetical protein
MDNSLQETLDASRILRQYTTCFESCIKKGKVIEARTYLPNIKKACEILGMDWRELLGIENERFFIGSTSAHNGSTSAHNGSTSAHNGSISAHNGSEIGSISAQKPKITALSHNIGSTSAQSICVCGCGRSMIGKKKGSIYFEKQCRNKARKQAS